ncbi:MAG: hypothetical protein QM651_15160 [Rhodoblastus sp.]
MSIALHMQNGDLVCRLFMRSSKLRVRRAVATDRLDFGVRLDLLHRQPLEALRTLGLTQEAAALAADARDWAWLTKAELSQALDAETRTLGVF